MSEEVAALAVEGIWRRFQQGAATLEILQGVRLAVWPGEIVALVGPSGAGKSTLLHVAGLLERPDEGQVWIGGEAMAGLNESQRTAARRQRIGFVYQHHHLLAEFSALENVAMPRLIAGEGKADALRHAVELLEAVGLASRADHRPAELSGGEQQRVAIARALANDPQMLLADEPTGNLDHATADTVFALLLDLCRRKRLAALVATHNLELAGRMDRILRLKDGVVAES
ncbi:MAG: ABC transporter ATP-binding protein [Alphaproteobacteria bacterium]